MLVFWFMRSYAHPIYITEIHSNPSLCTILLFLMSLDLFLFAKGHVKIYIGFLFTSQFASLIIPFIYTNQCTFTKSFSILFLFSSFSCTTPILLYSRKEKQKYFIKYYKFHMYYKLA